MRWRRRRIAHELRTNCARICARVARRLRAAHHALLEQRLGEDRLQRLAHRRRERGEEADEGELGLGDRRDRDADHHGHHRRRARRREPLLEHYPREEDGEDRPQRLHRVHKLDAHAHQAPPVRDERADHHRRDGQHRHRARARRRVRRVLADLAARARAGDRRAVRHHAAGRRHQLLQHRQRDRERERPQDLLRRDRRHRRRAVPHEQQADEAGGARPAERRHALHDVRRGGAEQRQLGHGRDGEQEGVQRRRHRRRRRRGPSARSGSATPARSTSATWCRLTLLRPFASAPAFPCCASRAAARPTAFQTHTARASLEIAVPPRA